MDHRAQKFHNDFTLLNKRRIVEHLLPQFTLGTCWCYSWVDCFSSWHMHMHMHQAIRSSFNSWVDWSNVSRVSCSRKQQHQSGIGSAYHGNWYCGQLTRLQALCMCMHGCVCARAWVCVCVRVCVCVWSSKITYWMFLLAYFPTSKWP